MLRPGWAGGLEVRSAGTGLSTRAVGKGAGVQHEGTLPCPLQGPMAGEGSPSAQGTRSEAPQPGGGASQGERPPLGDPVRPPPALPSLAQTGCETVHRTPRPRSAHEGAWSAGAFAGWSLRTLGGHRARRRCPGPSLRIVLPSLSGGPGSGVCGAFLRS